MDFSSLHKYCMDKPGVTDGLPFGDTVMVIKVGSKIYAFLSQNDEPVRISLKCDPFRAEDLRMEYESIIPGYHLNKQHWNTIIADGTVPDELLRELIDHSYDLIFKSLKKSVREEILGVE